MIKKILRTIYAILPLKRELFSIVRPFGLPEQIYKHLHFKGSFKVRIDPNLHFKINHIGVKVENEIFWAGLFGSWEKESMKIWTHLCKDSHQIFDIGANTGVYSLVAKCINPKSMVYAFEPVERVYDKLVNNCQLNQYNIQTNRLGLSNTDGFATIYDPGGDHLYSVTVNRNLQGKETNVTKYEIPIARFETWFTQQKVKGLDLIKIDVETHEPEVLEGMGKLLSEYKPTLLIEVLIDEVGQKIEKLIDGLNYQIFSIDEQKGASRQNSISKSPSYNYLLCQPQIAQKLIDHSVII